MTPSVDRFAPVSLLGLRFDERGWRSRFTPWRSVAWSSVREFDLSLQSGRGRFRYRLEVIDSNGRSLVLRVKGGMANFRKVTQILRVAQARNSRIRFHVFAKDILEIASLDTAALREAENPTAYELERRARLYLMALEFDLALEDGTTLMQLSPRHERLGRSLRLKALLLKGSLRAARRELDQIVGPDDEIDPEAKAEYAIVALYRGRREGVGMARSLLDSGKLECVELVGLEFSRYLADRSRFKEAISVLRTAENRTRLVDTDLFKTLQVARGEVLSKRDYRFYKYVGFLFKAPVHWCFFMALYVLGAGWLVFPESEAYQKAETRMRVGRQLNEQGVRGEVDRETLAVKSSEKGLATLYYGFYRSHYEKEAGAPPIFGITTMLATEARRFLNDQQAAHVLYLPHDASVNQLAPVDATRAVACWYEAFDKPLELLMMAGMGFGVVGITLGRRMLR